MQLGRERWQRAKWGRKRKMRYGVMRGEREISGKRDKRRERWSGERNEEEGKAKMRGERERYGERET